MLNFTLILPAYNEEKNILQTINCITPLLWTTIEKLIIINDASTDNTKELLDTLNNQNIEIIHNIKNLWKSASIARAIEKVETSHLMLLDADLLHLKSQNLIDLITPIQKWKVDATIAFIKNSRPLFPFKKIDYCNGQRVLAKKLFDTHLTELKQLPSYGLEVFINKLMIQSAISLQVVHRPKVENDFHQNKDGFWHGRKRNLKIWREVAQSAWGIFAIYKMNFQLEKLLKR